MLRRKKVFKTR